MALMQLGKLVDFSGVATVVAREDLAADRALLPREAALALYRPWIAAALRAEGHAASLKEAKDLLEQRDARALAALARMERPLVLLPETDEPRVTSVEVELWDERAIALSPRTLEALGLSAGDAVTFHVPVDPRAIDEARTRLRGAPGVGREVEDDGWMTRAARAEVPAMGALLFAAALRRERDPAVSTVARLTLGRLL